MNISLSPAPPYDFSLSAETFSGGDEQIRNFKDGTFWQVIRVNNRLVLVVVESTGTVDRPQLSVELLSDRDISADDELGAEKTIHSLLNLDLDLKPFYRLAQGDPVLSGIVKILRGLKSPLTSTPFEALVDSIIEQQISLIVAHSLQRKVIKSFGDCLKVKAGSYYAFPTPERLSLASIEDLRGCGLSLRKAEFIREISGLITQGKLTLDKYKDYQDLPAAIRELDEIRGIGVWTAEMTLIRGLGKLDAFPADDLGLRRIISHYYFQGRKISAEEARDIALKWGPWKALASFYLVIAEIKGIGL
jgi:DNA-3-methyladenine glycosylase II